MGLMCKISGHKWNGCKCERCSETRDEQHDWDLCKGICKRCGKKQPEQHDWNGCKCSRCGKIRDEQHDYQIVVDECKRKCTICGKVGGFHDWKTEYIDGECIHYCGVCGLKRTHDWEVMGNCRKKCSICGALAYDHDYKSVDSNDNGFVSWVSYLCRKCGHSAFTREDNRGKEEDTREYGLLKR